LKGETPVLYQRFSWTRLAPARRDSCYLIFLKGNGDGTFFVQLPLYIGGVSFAVAAADFDTNGTPDLVTANLFDNTLNILLNFTLPKLTLAKTNNQIAVTWSQLSGYTLESSTNLFNESFIWELDDGNKSSYFCKWQVSVNQFNDW
jgi:hypothetical protein